MCFVRKLVFSSFNPIFPFSTTIDNSFSFCACNQKAKSASRLHTSALVALLREDEGNDESVQTQSLGENENQNHADEELVLLADGTHTGVTDDTNGHTSGKTTTRCIIL